MQTHNNGFRPSHFPALTECIHHQSIDLEVDHLAALRGTSIHARITEVLTAETVHFDQEEPPVRFAAEWTIARIIEGWRVVGTELPVLVLDGDGQEITRGTIDLLLERQLEYQVVDWKTGDKNGYTPQISAYMSAVHDMYPKARKVFGSIVYLDLQETEYITLDAARCFDLVYTLWKRWEEKENEPYIISRYCDYCGIRAACPAWRQSGADALDTVAELGTPAGAALVTAKIDALKNHPQKLEQFLIAWERAKTLVETDWKLKEALKTWLENGFKAEHHILVNVKDSSQIVRSIDPEKFLETLAREMGYSRVAPAIKVDADKAITLWRDFYGYGDDAKFPVPIKEEIVEKSGYSYVRAKGKPGAGDARKKRKEME